MGSDLDAVAYTIADNKTADFAQFDEPALAALLEQLKAEESALRPSSWASVQK